MRLWAGRQYKSTAAEDECLNLGRHSNNLPLMVPPVAEIQIPGVFISHSKSRCSGSHFPTMQAYTKSVKFPGARYLDIGTPENLLKAVRDCYQPE